MPFVAAPNIIECQFRGTLDGQQVMNRIHVNVTGTPTEGDCATVAAAAAQWWLDNVQDLVVVTASLREVFCKSLEEENGPQASFTAGLPASGTIDLDGLPNNCALCVSLRTGLSGRSARGRWFWYGFADTQANGSTVVGGVRDSIDAAMTNLLAVIEALSALWVIVSFIHNGAPRAGGPVYFVVTNIVIIDDTIDSQRRRLPGRGN